MTDRNIAPTAKKNVSAPAPRTPSGPLFEEETLPDPPPGPTAGAGKSVPPAVGAAATGLPAERPPRPTTLAEAYPWLLKPFRQADVELKPTALTKDRSRALASPYADPRVYFARLDKICGPENWSTELTFAERGCCCRLTIFGVTKTAGGDYPLDKSDENPATSAEMQAFKRACAAFGLGRYLYHLPQVWAAYDDQKKQIIDAAGVIKQMYGALPKNGDE